MLVELDGAIDPRFAEFTLMAPSFDGDDDPKFVLVVLVVSDEGTRLAICWGRSSRFTIVKVLAATIGVLSVGAGVDPKLASD